MGNNTSGSSAQTYPQKVLRQSDSQPLINIVQVGAGDAHTLALDTDGKVWAWGANVWGQLGDGTTVDRAMAVPVVDETGTGQLQNVVHIAAGGADLYGTSLAITDDGRVLTWGANDKGQLGIGWAGSGATTVPTVQPESILQKTVREGAPSVGLSVDQAASGSSTVTLIATPSHTGLGGAALIDRVEIFADGVLQGTLTGSPWELPVTLAAGPHHLYATVFDSEGVSSMSPSRFVYSSSSSFGDDDSDGIANWIEVELLGFDPSNPDTDGDGIGDAEEDVDGDGLADLQEALLGVSSRYYADGDGDGLSDATELALGLNPLLSDSDYDGVDDGLDGLGLDAGATVPSDSTPGSGPSIMILTPGVISL